MSERYRLIKPNWARPKLGNKENPDFVREIEGPSTIEGELTDQELKKYNDLGYNIYFLPNKPSKSDLGKPYASGKDIDVYRYVFVDMDLKDGVYKSKKEFLANLKDFEVEPTFIVDSGNGIHAYWKVRQLDVEAYMVLQFMLIQRFKTDESVWTPLQLMRVPGYLNTKKHDNFIPAQELSNTGKEYSIEELVEHLPKITEENDLSLENHLRRLRGEAPELNLDEGEVDNLPLSFDEFLKIQRLFEDPIGTKGDRSSADFELCCLLKKKGLDSKDALKVMANTLKARSRVDRLDYALNIVEKVYDKTIDEIKKDPYEVKSMAEVLREDEKALVQSPPVMGPYFMDCLEKPWRRKHVMGLVAGTGGGKSTVSLKILRDMAMSNKDPNEIFVFFSLEMERDVVFDRWSALTGSDESMAEKLYVITNENDDGEPREIGYQQMYLFCKSIEKRTGKKISAVVIDHIGILSDTLDMRIEPTFNAQAEEGRGNIRTLSIKSKCTKLKQLAKMLDVFLLVQSQSTKERAGEGDLPLPLSAAYGAAQFEWICDYIITCWQPLKRIESKTDLRVLAWQYNKNRHKGVNDPIKLNDLRLLKYFPQTHDLTPLVNGEWDEFVRAEAEAREVRKNAGKNEYEYFNSPTKESLDKIFNKRN